jgi:hypothetical protein
MKQTELDTLNENNVFTGRELGLIINSVDYANDKPYGLPGHNLCIIIFKLVNIILTLRGENAIS